MSTFNDGDRQQTTSVVIESIRKRYDSRDSRIEQMPLIKNPIPGSVDPGKVGTERKKVIPYNPPPPERAIEVQQKHAVMLALAKKWVEVPYLRLGELLFLASKGDVKNIEDLTLATLIVEFDPDAETRCNNLSHSRAFKCTLEKGHEGNRHLNHELAASWQS